MTPFLAMKTLVFVLLLGSACYLLVNDLRKGKESLVRIFGRWMRHLVDLIFGL